MKNFWQWSGLGLTMAFAGILSGCGGNTPTQTSNDSAASTSGTPAGESTAKSSTTGAKLDGAGATFPYPLYSKWFQAYKDAKGVQIDYTANGSGSGITALADGTVNFAASDAVLSAKDKAKMPSEVAQIPTVGGAVVVVYNLEGAPKNMKLDGPTLAGIYLGKINKWDDKAIAAANPGVSLPSKPIVVAHRTDGSGTTNIFTTYLAAVSPEWKTTVGAGKAVDWPTGIGGKGNDGVASSVQKSPGSIGYVELAYAKQNNLSYAAIKNKAGQFVVPSAAGVTAAAEGALPAVKKDITAPIANADGAKSYPISAFTYILAYKKAKDSAKNKELASFLTWAMTDGQKSAESLDYAPLPAAIVSMNKATIAELK
jgi:phosphate transport system substrate-binding protein